MKESEFRTGLAALCAVSTETDIGVIWTLHSEVPFHVLTLVICAECVTLFMIPSRILCVCLAQKEGWYASGRVFPAPLPFALAAAGSTSPSSSAAAAAAGAGGAAPEDAVLLQALEQPHVADDCAETSMGSPSSPSLLLLLHIVYSHTFAVPCLLLHLSRPGASLALVSEPENRVFDVCGAAADGTPVPHCAVLAGVAASASVDGLLDTVVTQQEHPVTGQPFYGLHPCRTADRMALVLREGGDYLLSWWAMMSAEVCVHVPAAGFAAAATTPT